MTKRRKGCVLKRDGKWWARLRFTDEFGKLRELRRGADSKAAASDLLDTLRDQAARTRGRSLRHHSRTFADLSDFYLQTELIAAEYRQGKKIAGKRPKSLDTMIRQLSILEREFGVTREEPEWWTSPREKLFGRVLTPGLKLDSISYGDLKRLSIRRFKKRTRTGAERTPATVNRELTMLNRMFTIAVREEWMQENPFKRGQSLIVKAHEEKRDKPETILSRADEARLLEACNTETMEGRRLHAILIVALDSGMRQGEIFELRVGDVDLEKRTVQVQAMNAKTLRSRTVPLTLRARIALVRWLKRYPAPADGPLFGSTTNVKRAYGIARKAAELPHVRFHDLRHTAATRMIQGGLPLAEVARVLGHSDVRMTYRYVNADTTTITRAAAVLDQGNEDAAKQLATATNEPAHIEPVN